jgi:hypothetical protein
MPTVFLSHNWKDKRFVRRLAKRLTKSGVVIWLDEVELKIGDSLVHKISQAVAQADFVIAVISKNSTQSPWVTKEIGLGMSKEIGGRGTVVLPLRIDDCELPPSLQDKLYADFRSPRSFERECVKLLNTMGIKADRTKYSHGLSVEWTAKGPRIMGNNVVLAPTEATAILNRYLKFWPKFIKEQEKEIGKGNPLVGPRAHLAAVLRSCYETYDAVPVEKEMAGLLTELARKFDLFYRFIEAMHLEATISHRKQEPQNRRAKGSLYEDAVGPRGQPTDRRLKKRT